ncbi:MAG TPA: OsmC family protein [Terracidiphilus sp.]|nr:OsmC family protein [Terracidiphilus sp.]
MQISATVVNQDGHHQSLVRTGDRAQSLAIPAKVGGFGSGINGGELLFLALATCYCNDIYREAKERGLDVQSVEVEVTGEFGGKGAPAENITYRASVKANGSETEVLDLMRYTDSVAEIHNTLRRATPVILSQCQAGSPSPRA